MYSKTSNSYPVRTKKPVLGFGLVIFLVATLLLAACSSDTSQTEQPQTPADASVALVNTTWVLVGYGEAANPIVTK
ncbi:hypothetical protein ACFLUA_00705, partial [Chloroflexota bacterium]